MCLTIRAVYCRCTPQHSIFDVLPTSVLTRPVKERDVSAFSTVWARNSALCQVDYDAAGKPSLRVWLSMLHPVAAPAAPV